MSAWPKTLFLAVVCAVLTTVPLARWAGASPLNLGPEELVQAGGAEIGVSGYSVPCYADLNGDDVNDLIVGEGSGSLPAKIRIYANVGTAAAPLFADFSYTQSEGTDLTLQSGGCLGVFPLAIDWNADGKRDLLAGRADGTVQLFTNVGTAQLPAFDGGTYLQAGPPGAKTTIDVGARATPCAVDWNNDGRTDLAVGALDGKVHLYLDGATEGEPDFLAETFAQEDGHDLLVPGVRSSPVVLDLDGDGMKDLLTGNTEGRLLLYGNTGTDAAPAFSGYDAVTSESVPIDLFGQPRSRPFVTDWTGDGLPDVLIGAGDGRVHLFQGVPEPTTLALLALGAATLLCQTFASRSAKNRHRGG